MENYDRQQDGGAPPPESVEQADANAGVEHIEITLEEAAAMEKEQLEAWGKRYAENALERERLRAEELEHDAVITKAREHAIENSERHRVLDELRRGAEQIGRPKEDAQEREERLAKFAEEWLQREQQQKERPQQPVEEKTAEENLDEYVQQQYKWAKNELKDNDLKWLLEHDTNFREEWVEGQPLDDPLAKEMLERFPPREEKHMDEPVNDPGAGDAVNTGFEHAPGEEGVDHTDEAIINPDKDVLEGYYHGSVGDEEGADRTDEPANDPVAGDAFEDGFGYDPGEGGADRNYESMYGTYESMYGTEDSGEDGADRADGPVVGTDEGYYRDVGDEEGADYMDDFGIDAVEGDPAPSGFGEHAYESFGDAGEAFDDSFDSDW